MQNIFLDDILTLFSRSCNFSPYIVYILELEWNTVDRKKDKRKEQLDRAAGIN